MVVLRCTERLRKRLKRTEEPGQSTTALGDWYGNLIRLGPRQVLLFVSERSRLPVMLPAQEAKDLERALPAALARMLRAIGVPDDAVARECAAMTSIAVASTTNRSVVGTMVDDAFMAKDVVGRGLVKSEFELALWLADAPIIAIGGGDAITHTRAVFGLAPLPPRARPWRGADGGQA